MATNVDRLSVLARNLRVLAAAAENASGPREMTGIILGLQSAIGLVSLCLFNWNKKMIQNTAHDLDRNEMRDGRLL